MLGCRPVFGDRPLYSTCQVSPEVSKKKEGVCFEKQNAHMNGGYVFQMNSLHMTVYMKADHYTYLWHKIPSTLNKEAYFSRRNIHGYKEHSKFTDEISLSDFCLE
jgi:hypothetical protein